MQDIDVQFTYEGWIHCICALWMKRFTFACILFLCMFGIITSNNSVSLWWMCRIVVVICFYGVLHAIIWVWYDIQCMYQYMEIYHLLCYLMVTFNIRIKNHHGWFLNSILNLFECEWFNFKWFCALFCIIIVLVWSFAKEAMPMWVRVVVR